MTATQLTRERIGSQVESTRTSGRRRKGFVVGLGLAIAGGALWIGIAAGTGGGTVTVPDSEFQSALKRYHEMELAPVSQPDPGYQDAFKRMKEAENASVSPSVAGSDAAEALKRLHQDAAVPSN